MSDPDGSKLLFERWRSAAARFPGELALVEFASGRRWTFRELFRESEEGAAGSSGAIAFPRGHNAEFVLQILRAWREGQAACPLEASQPSPEIDPAPASWAHLKLTSASTGKAKCIGFTADQLAADPAQIVSTMGLRPDWPNLACISLAHSYGFSNFILPLALHAIPLLIAPAPLPEVVARAARMFPHITLAAVPALWRTWHESKAIPPNVKLAISAGAPLALDLEQEIFARGGLKVHNFYGSSECGGIAYDRSELPRTDPSLAGAALDNVSLSVGPAGTLVVESAAVGAAYWPDAQPSLRAPRFETSDLAEIRDGQIYLRGRASDLINVAGRKASPEAIETVLRRHPGVEECLVFGAQDPPGDRMDTIVACIQAREQIAITELTRFLSDKLPGWQIPRRWWFTPDLRTNERGKFSRAEWRKRFLAAHGGEAFPGKL